MDTLTILKFLSLFTFLPMKMEQIEFSKTLPYKTQMLGNYPEENIISILIMFSWDWLSSVCKLDDIVTILTFTMEIFDLIVSRNIANHNLGLYSLSQMPRHCLKLDCDHTLSSLLFTVIQLFNPIHSDPDSVIKLQTRWQYLALVCL
jgi:hypothetical protein